MGTGQAATVRPRCLAGTDAGDRRPRPAPRVQGHEAGATPASTCHLPFLCPSRHSSALLLTPLPHRNGPSRLQTQKRLGPDRGSLPRDRPRPLPPSFLPQVDAVYATTQAVHAAHKRMGSALKTQEGEQHGGISKKNTTFQPELPSAGLGMNRAAVRLPRRARRWPAACGDHGPGAGDQGPRAGDRGPRDGDQGPRAGDHGPHAGDHEPRAGDHGGVRVAGSSVRGRTAAQPPAPCPPRRPRAGGGLPWA